MNSIKKTSLTLAVLAIVMVVCISAAPIDESDAELTVSDVTYIGNSQGGIFYLQVNSNLAGEPIVVSINSTADQYRGIVSEDGSVICTPNGDVTPLTSTSPQGYDIEVSAFAQKVVKDNVVIRSISFDENGGAGSDVADTIFATAGANVSIPDVDWTLDGQGFKGWSEDKAATEADVAPGDYVVPDRNIELFAVYGTEPVTTEITISVTGNGADVTADGLVNGKITAKVGDKLTFDVIAHQGYTLDGATYTYNKQTIDITGGSFTITVAEGADTLVVDAVKEEQPVEPVTVTVSSIGAQITYDGKTVTGSVQLMPGSDATFGITALEGYTMEGCSVTYNGQSVTVENGAFTITVAEAGGEIVVVLREDKPVLYNVTVTSNNTSMGTASADPESARAGETVSLTATPNDGYRFVEWNVISGDVEIKGDSFVMPASNVAISAVFEAVPPTEYTIYVETATGGTATASATTATAGTLIILTAIPDDGYVLDYWVINEDITTNSTFRMPEGNVTVTPVFRLLENYDVTIRISGDGTVLYNGAEISNGSAIKVREQSDLVLTYTAGTDNYTVRCTVSDENARVSNANGTLTVTGISKNCDVTIEFVKGYMVTVADSEHGDVFPGTGLQPENTTVTYTVMPDSGYAVSRVLVDGQEVEVIGNEFQVEIGESAHTISVEYVYVGIVDDDDDEEYVPPVVVVRPDDGGDSTTYIVAIAAAAVVAILAALILMQTRKS